ncbi:CDP-glucose 4,6-dehydratase [Paracoccus benzoatiresistens]|uniref:CDP-glucose 4,6-dehydratase n=1 Tax=Paracoccus benzoatiresistens TaxID=2997341 RepID=A0ABT4J1X8_9RHOB|nr:CDP-glucose 4,6-dehydratase [Paracoccus sp. EF6]MCZ0960642.1 CDP-glucose 4,6-dehydratase [Paracoccus sp. EF6]
MQVRWVISPGSRLNGKRILLTGHTGFKGSWLALWLARLGAQVRGVALPPQEPSMFDRVGGGDLVESRLADINDLSALRQAVEGFRPEIIIHMAAQSLVRASYADPVGTFLTNVIGTANVMQLGRDEPDLRGIIVVTSDKCYENREWVWGYRETDPMGGKDPYSASKGAAELAAAAWSQSFFQAPGGPRIARARSGNVFGGGDWAGDRLVPDLVRAARSDQPAIIRNPGSVRPWQHVLEPLAGYLMLAELLLVDPDRAEGAWNFGPGTEATVDVATLVATLSRHWPGGGLPYCMEPAFDGLPEAGLLRLDSTKATVRLGWKPRLDLSRALRLTAEWYIADARGDDMRELTQGQIASYEELCGRDLALHPMNDGASA